MAQPSNKAVAYFYDEEIGNFCYGGGNPMRPHRARLTYSLVDNYGLGKQLIIHRPVPRSFEQLTEFHADGEAGGLAWPGCAGWWLVAWGGRSGGSARRKRSVLDRGAG